MDLFHRLILSFLCSIGIILAIEVILFAISALFVSGPEGLALFIIFMWPIMIPIAGPIVLSIVWFCSYKFLIKK